MKKKDKKAERILKDIKADAPRLRPRATVFKSKKDYDRKKLKQETAKEVSSANLKED